MTRPLLFLRCGRPGAWLLGLVLGLLLASTAQAQITVDGRASASEIGPGKYQLVASYSGTHSVPDRGLKSLYVARTATTLNIILVASPELSTDYSSLVLYLNGPGRSGTPAGTRLAGGSASVSPLLHRPVLDMEADYGLRLTTLPGGDPTVYYSAVDYTVAPTNGRNPDTDLGNAANNGQVLTVGGNLLAGARMAFVRTASVAANSTTGWELEIPLTAVGAQAGSTLELFGAFTDGAGEFTTDIFPQVSGRTTAFGLDPDFTTVAGTQLIRSAALTFDGRLDANEIGTGTAGLYQLVGEFPTARPAGFGDWGFTKLYMASTATKLYFFVVGTVENNGNAFQLYLNVPGLTGVARGTALPGTGSGSTTSFRNMRAKLDMETDLAVALEGTGPAYSVSLVRYAGGLSESRGTGTQPINGSPFTYNTIGSVPQLNGLTLAYRDSPAGNLSTNPGNYGWELELDRAALGVPATLANATVQAFLLQNSSDGDFLSSDVIPPVPGNGGVNFGNSASVDFTQLPGRQALTYALTCPVATSLRYGAASFCQSATNPTPTVTGPVGGSFSAGTGLSLNPVTGTVDLAASTPGTYSVTYNADVVNCPTSASTQLTVTRPATATFSYGAAAYCVSGPATPTPALAAGASAGSFSASPAGLVLQAATGAITLAGSQPGTYTVTNTLAASGGCATVAASTTVTINPLPTATITAGGPTTFCQGGSVVLTASGGTSYQWSTGATSAPLSVTAGGTYSVTVTSAAGCSSTASTTVTVNPFASAAFRYAAAAYCQSAPNPTPTVSGTAGGSFSTTAGLSLNPQSGEINLAASQPGTYTITYAAGTSCPATATATVTVTAPATAGFGYPAAAYCASTSGSVAALLSTGATAGTFSSAAGLTLDAATGAITPATSQPGTYTVTNTVAAAGGCAAVTAATSVTITAPATAGFGYASSNFCTSTTGVMVPALVAGATAGTFSSAAGLTLDAATGSITPATSQPGTYTVTNTVAASGGCAAVTATTAVTIAAPATAGFRYANASSCAGTTGTAAPTLAAGATAGTFSSTAGLALNSGTGIIDLGSSQPGTYTVTNTVAASGACAAVAASTTITINALPTATLTAGGPTTFCQGGSVMLAAPTGAGLTYQFLLNGQPIGGATGSSYAASQGGSFAVLVSNGAGCGSTSTAVAVTVNPTPATPTLTATPQPGGTVLLTSSASAGNQFYLNGQAIGGATGQTYVAAAGSQSGAYTVVVKAAATGCASAASAPVSVVVTSTARPAAGFALQAAPNPSPDGRFTLEVSGLSAAAEVVILNTVGQVVSRRQLPAHTTRQSLDLSQLPTGVYLLRATGAQGTRTLRLVRE